MDGPRSLYKSNRFDFEVDIWALGCIFRYTLSGGKHPFGDDPDNRAVLIKEKKSTLMVREDLKGAYSNDCVALGLKR